MNPGLDLYPSSEVRWFRREKNGEDKTRELERLRALLGLANEAPEERVDSYLLLPNEAVGVKLRQGNLEIKVRTARTWGELPEARTGWVEQWTKWSHKAGTSAAAISEVAHTGRWVALRKRRWLFKVEGVGAAARRLPVGAFPECGANVELTDLAILAADGSTRLDLDWTFGLEAFGGLSLNLGALTAGLHLADPVLTRMQLTRDESMGYPEWLIRREG